MKQKYLLQSALTVLAFTTMTLSFTACDNDEDTPKTAPTVTTSAMTNITTTSATGGGNITSDGNSAVTASGLVYSSTNTMPMLTDSKTTGNTSSGAFTAPLEGLSSGKTYHVRAYATNNIGTGYGAVVDFTTGNSAPTVSDIVINGDVEVSKKLSATYSYADIENDEENGTTFRWYIADDGSGTNEKKIENATEAIYTAIPEDEFKYLRVGVTPMSQTGTTLGTEVKSLYVGPIVESTTVTFIYNGNEVTYGIITSSATGRKWMDRNLGALQSARSLQDHLAYGDLFQWGRGPDGHQLITWAQDILVGLSTPVTGTTTALSQDDTPDNSLFVMPDMTPFDWRDPQNSTLWNAPDFVNNPCPSGWHIPTSDEWDAEKIDVIEGNELKITAAGGRRFDNGSLYNDNSGPGRQGWYWSASASPTAIGKYRYYSFTITAEGGIYGYNWTRNADFPAYGFSCRCLQNGEPE